MTARPRVSVLLPVRDARESLPACLASLRRQSLRDYEIVAIDDGSVDGSGELLARAARADARLRVVSTPPRGIACALNTGLAEARAPLLARMDADDVAHAERLALQVGRLEADPETTVLGSRVRLLAERGRQAGGMKRYVAWLNELLEHDAIAQDLLVESPLAHPSVTMRAAPLKRLGGYRSFDGPEDYDLWLRGFRAGWRFAKLPQVLLGWRDGGARLTRNDPRYRPACFQALKLEALESGPLREPRPLVIWGAGPTGKDWARALLARGHRLLAFVDVDPRRIGQRIHGAPVLAVDRLPWQRGPLHLAAVGRSEARKRIRDEAQARGLREGHDLIAVA
jgi:glycosyltransferase involved in cell wall biosynthesis